MLTSKKICKQTSKLTKGIAVLSILLHCYVCSLNCLNFVEMKVQRKSSHLLYLLLKKAISQP